MNYENNAEKKLEPPFVGYRKDKERTIIAAFHFNDAFGDREVVYTKENLEKRIQNLKASSQPFAEAEEALTNWPKE